MPVELPSIQLITYNYEDGAKAIFNKKEDLGSTKALSDLERLLKRHIQGRRDRLQVICQEQVEEVKTSQTQHSITASYDYNCLAAVEKMKKDDFEIVVFSDENNKKNNKMNDDWIINV
ncbi:hypothetical protein CIHG_06509 [Coccidioides immitis H538.4]|uniref:Uncharacterized protein n=1 Tax=Coccidioides immitis H538.4 TaxID=396776 RepID=A0A0J8RVL7_COCIT|nr:hypothetical protein CIHG_06509 [Coccidioides immitis H538.4]